MAFFEYSSQAQVKYSLVDVVGGLTPGALVRVGGRGNLIEQRALNN